MPANFGAFGDNPFSSFLEEEPRAAFFAHQDQWRTPNMRNYFQNQFSNIQNQYMGALGKQIMGGQAPTLQFRDFLSQFPWQQKFQELPPGERGQDTSRFNPFVRWLT